MPKKKDPMIKIQLRIPKRDLARARARASTYADANLSKWIRYCLTVAPPKKLDK